MIDQTRCGVVLYNEDGLYVDTLFPDPKRFSRSTVGVYALPGEFFAGDVVPNRSSGKILLAFGKYTPLLFEAVGWSLKENPVRPLAGLPQTRHDRRPADRQPAGRRPVLPRRRGNGPAGALRRRPAARRSTGR